MIAACACGALMASVTADPIRVAICHCNACRTRTGSAFSWNARFADDTVKINGRSKSFVRVGDEGSEIKYHFCPDCGVTVWYETSGVAGKAIPVGAFAPIEGPAPLSSVFHTRHPAWLRVTAETEIG